MTDDGRGIPLATIRQAGTIGIVVAVEAATAAA
jgi:hypothetical protein